MLVKPRYNISLLTLLAAVVMLTLSTACSDDDRPEVSETDILGIYAGEDGTFMELDDTDYIYQYNMQELRGVQYWIKRKLTYLYEPVSELMLKQDIEGLLQVYKVTEHNDQGMTLCWLETPMQEPVEGDARFEIIQVFFKTDYEIDPANEVHYQKIDAEQLQRDLGDIEVIEAY